MHVRRDPAVIERDFSRLEAELCNVAARRVDQRAGGAVDARLQASKHGARVAKLGVASGTSQLFTPDAHSRTSLPSLTGRTMTRSKQKTITVSALCAARRMSESVMKATA